MLLGLEWKRRVAHVFARRRDCEEVRLEYKPHRAILIMWKRTKIPSEKETIWTHIVDESEYRNDAGVGHSKYLPYAACCHMHDLQIKKCMRLP